MKKIFLPLLAAVGMALGLTLTSCGGGGGSSKDGAQPARALAGTTLTSTSKTPCFTLKFEIANTGWTIASTFTPGEAKKKSYPCYFNLTRAPKLVEGNWEVWGSIGWVDIDILKDDSFLALLGANSTASSCTIEQFVLVLNIPSGKQPGVYSGDGQMMVEGRFYMHDGEAEGTKITGKTVKFNFEMEGQVKEKYFKGFTEEDTNDKPFDY